MPGRAHRSLCRRGACLKARFCRARSGYEGGRRRRQRAHAFVFAAQLVCIADCGIRAVAGRAGGVRRWGRGGGFPRTCVPQAGDLLLAHVGGAAPCQQCSQELAGCSASGGGASVDRQRHCDRGGLFFFQWRERRRRPAAATRWPRHRPRRHTPACLVPTTAPRAPARPGLPARPAISATTSTQYRWASRRTLLSLH
jgi:hypothetical protein